MGCYRDKAGAPLNTKEWARLFEDMQYRRVAATTTRTGHWVSTVWLGLDGEIFETMVTDVAGEWVDFCDRYETLAEAQAGHAAAVERFSQLELVGWDANGSPTTEAA